MSLQLSLEDLRNTLRRLKKHKAAGEKLKKELAEYLRDPFKEEIEVIQARDTALRLKMCGVEIVIQTELKPDLPNIDARLVAYIVVLDGLESIGKPFEFDEDGHSATGGKASWEAQFTQDLLSDLILKRKEKFVPDRPPQDFRQFPTPKLSE